MNIIKKMIIIGKIQKPYGILGWMHVISYTQLKKNIFSYLPWYIGENYDITINSNDFEIWKRYKKWFVIKLKNIKNRNDTHKLIQRNISIPENKIPNLLNNEFYWKDIIQCKVYDTKKKYLGIISRISENIIYDLLIITSIKHKKKKTIYVPFIYPKIVKKVSINTKEIIINYNLLKII